MCKDRRDDATESGKYKCAQRGCSECLEALLASHRRLVVAVIKGQ